MALNDYGLLALNELSKAQQARLRIQNDPALSELGRQQRIASDVAPFEAEAQKWGTAWLDGLNRQRDKAEADLAEARRRASAAVNTQRRAEHRTLINDTVARGDWPTVRQALDRALNAGDQDEIAAWQSAAPTLHDRFPARSGGPASDPSTGWGKYSGLLSAAIPEPPEIEAATESLERAKGAIYEARGKLSNADLGAQYRGGPQVFATVLRPPGQTVTVGGPGEGNWVISHDGKGAFG